MRFQVTHNTTYRCSEPVTVGHNQAWLKPRMLDWQTLENFELRINPFPDTISSTKDFFGNEVHSFSFNEGYSVLEVTSKSTIALDRQRPVDSAGNEFTSSTVPNQATVPAELPIDLDQVQFRIASPLTAAFSDGVTYVQESFRESMSTFDSVMELMHRIHADFEFDPSATTVSTPVERVFELKKGVCQDFAHLMLTLLRSQGIACRYVSGYLRTFPPPGKPRLVGADASHAWVSVYCGDALGWVDFDPTNDCLAINDHITIGYGRDYSDMPPLRGVFLGGGTLKLDVRVDVLPLDK